MSDNIIPFSGNRRQAPKQERLTPAEIPLMRGYEGTVDAAVVNMYRQVVRIPLGRIAEQVTPEQSSVPANVVDIATNPRYAQADNDPSMAQLARDAINLASNPFIPGADDVQKAA